MADSSGDQDHGTILLVVMGENVTPMVKVGTVKSAKVVNQLASVSTQVTVAGAMGLARRSGLDLDTLVPAFAGGAAGTVVVQVVGPRMAATDWSITAHMDIALKGRGIVLHAAEVCGLDLQSTEIAQERWVDAVRRIGAGRYITENVRLVAPEFSAGGNDVVGPETGD